MVIKSWKIIFILKNDYSKTYYPVYTSTLEQHTPLDIMLFNLYTELQHKSEDSSFALFFRTLADIV